MLLITATDILLTMATRCACILIQLTAVLSTPIDSTTHTEFGHTQLGQLNLPEDKRNVYEFDTKVRKKGFHCC